MFRRIVVGLHELVIDIEECGLALSRSVGQGRVDMAGIGCCRFAVILHDNTAVWWHGLVAAQMCRHVLVVDMELGHGLVSGLLANETSESLVANLRKAAAVAPGDELQ